MRRPLSRARVAAGAVLTTACAALLLVAASLAPAGAQAPAAVIAISGQGAGLGVGLSQAGARGMAADGRTAAEILRWFFPGTTLTSGADPAFDESLRTSRAPMASSAPVEALRAQAIAARTALAHDGIPTSITHPEPVPDDPAWDAAVQATAGQIVTWGLAPIRSVWTASTGGRTEAAIEVGSTQEPYLVPVDDPWSLEDPAASWTVQAPASDVAAAFGLPDVVSIDDRPHRTAGGGAKVVEATASDGSRSTLSGAAFRASLGLPSHVTGPGARRVAGADRFETSTAAGQAAAPASGPSTPPVSPASMVPPSIVVVSGEADHLVDGLVAAPLAVSRGAPVLLARADGLPPPVAADVVRRQPTKATLIGGFAALGPAVEQELRAAGVSMIERLAGPDRYATAVSVASALGGSAPTIVVASGSPGHLVDALSAGGYAAARRMPVLLSAERHLPADTAAAIGRLGSSSTVVAGGSAAIGDEVVARLPSPRRLAGVDRFGTAVALASDSQSVGPAVSRASDGPPVVLTSGGEAHLVDALAAGAFGRSILLTAGSALHATTADALLALRPSAVDVVGGRAAVSLAALAQADALLGPTGSLPSRIVGFDEVAFAVQPVSGPASVGCAPLADTATRRTVGLSDRDDLAGYDGMVFAYESDTTASFWMRSTRFPLSIAWFATSGFVGSADMEPCPDGAECPLHPPPAPYRIALEVPKGDLTRFGVAPGSTIFVGGSCATRPDVVPSNA